MFHHNKKKKFLKIPRSAKKTAASFKPKIDLSDTSAFEAFSEQNKFTKLFGQNNFVC